MFREFFLSSNPLRCAWAWFGLCINFFMVVFYVWNSLRMNRWQGEFYDAVGTVKRLGLSHEEAVDLMYGLVWRWFSIMGSEIVVLPAAKILTTFWKNSWCFALYDRYIELYTARRIQLEGAPQRIQEDVKQHVNFFESMSGAVLNTVFALFSFMPLLNSAGALVPLWGFELGELPDWWLSAFVVGCCILFSGISILIGKDLVPVQVTYQIRQARLRKDLVLVERAYEDDSNFKEAPIITKASHVNSDWADVPLPNHFVPVLDHLWHSTIDMYLNYAKMEMWLPMTMGFPEYITVLLFFLRLIAPDPSDRLTYGQMRQCQNAIGHVYMALNFFTDHWIDITEWLSVVRRLRELEAQIMSDATDEDRRSTYRPSTYRANPPTRQQIVPSSDGSKQVVDKKEASFASPQSTRPSSSTTSTSSPKAQNEQVRLLNAAACVNAIREVKARLADPTLETTDPKKALDELRALFAEMEVQVEASTEQASRASVGEARTPHQLPRRRSMTPTFVANAARRSSRLFGSRQRTEAPTFDGLQTFLRRQSEAAMLPRYNGHRGSIYQV